MIETIVPPVALTMRTLIRENDGSSTNHGSVALCETMELAIII